MPVTVGYETVVVSVRGIPAAAEQWIVAEQHQEQPLELLAENNIDDEVDAGIDGDQQVAGLYHDRQVYVYVEGVDDVYDQR